MKIVDFSEQNLSKQKKIIKISVLKLKSETGEPICYMSTASYQKRAITFTKQNKN